MVFGIQAQEGEFRRGDLVRCLDPGGREIARGLINLDSHLLQHCRTQLAEEGDVADDFRVAIHRDNLVRSQT
ncbi:PUA domain-containing protein [Acidithiobacillus sp. AMEEHan]|uniref:PUA domain-containing protein n=1 Tax=Acidithiobacillus sp. AMEEHan TaxID=2994951 RepID=UPI0027E5513B|nr:PUA domain-containing protein [Acidithiobacillus sp. AMEEHan]